MHDSLVIWDQYKHALNELKVIQYELDYLVKLIPPHTINDCLISSEGCPLCNPLKLNDV